MGAKEILNTHGDLNLTMACHGSLLQLANIMDLVYMYVPLLIYL